MYVLLAHWLLFLASQQAFNSALPATSVVCVACRADLDAMRQGYPADDRDALARGEIVTSETEEIQADGSVQSHIQSSAIIPYPVALVWSVVSDVEARPKFIPGVKDVRIMRVEGNRIWVAQHLRYFLWNIRYQVVDTLDAEHGRVVWTLDKSVDHDIADSSGSWQIAPLPGQATLVRYRAWIDTGRPVPRFIAEFFTNRSLPKVVGGLRSEVQRRVQQ